MAKKPIVEIRNDETAPLQFVGQMSREQYQRIINKYEKQNPVKFKAKQAALLARLEKLPTQEQVDAAVAAAKRAAEDGE